MMGTTAIVQSFERVVDDNGKGVDVTIETAGEDNVDVAEHFANSGDDAPPLKGDFAAIDDAPGAGALRVTGYVDSKNLGKALGGEKRFYSRHPDTGAVIAEGWLHGNGLVEFISLKTGVAFKFGLVEIDDHGNITTPGEITAKAGTPTMVTLTMHAHGSGTGPTTAPIPGA